MEEIIMKNILKSLILLTLCTSLSGCEDFLTKTPETSLSPSSFFSSEKEMQLWTNKDMSNILPDCGSLAAIKSDDYIGKALDAIQKGTRTTATAGNWTQSNWGNLRHINQFFENCDRSKDDAVRLKYEGIEHFLRAWYYFTMLKDYGDVPYYDYVIASDDAQSLMKPRDSRGYVAAKILADLDAAIEKLPESWPEGATRVNKYAAAAFKSRVALFEGTYRKYHSVPDETVDGVQISSAWFLNQAADAALMVIRSGQYRLYTDNTMGRSQPYREFFQLESLKDNPEAVFYRIYDVDLLIRHSIQFDAKSNGYSATRRQVNHYLLKNGQPIQTRTGWEKEQYYEQFQNRDPRLSQTIHGPGYFGYLDAAMAGAVEKIDFARTVNGYRVIKHIANGSHENSTTSTTDWAYIRYAEVLLNYAEAKAELGTLTQEDIDMSIKPIRSRANMPNLTLPLAPDALMAAYYPHASGTQIAAILEIRRERVVELFAEGFHRSDMLRWAEGSFITPAGTLSAEASSVDPSMGTPGYKGIYIPALGEYDTDHDGLNDLLIYMSGNKPSTVSSSISATNQVEIGVNSRSLSEGDHGYLTLFEAEDYQWQNRDYLYPVPISQIQAYTNGALEQNPGWE